MKRAVSVLLVIFQCWSGVVSGGESLFKTKWREHLTASLVAAAEQGDYTAQLSLADKALLSGGGRGEGVRWAAFWLRQAAQSGRPEAQYLLAKVLFVEAGTDKHLRSESVRWMKRAAEQDWLPAQLSLAARLADDNVSASLRWYRRAANLNSPDAQLWLARMNYQKGEFQQALFWLNGAAQTLPEALALTAIIRMRGSLTYEAGVEIVALLSRAYDGGYYPALLWLARCYVDGIGVERSLRQARHYLLVAVQHGVPGAEQYLVDVSLLAILSGESEAFEQLHARAAEGDGAAMNKLGMIWRSGVAVEQDMQIARYWYQRSAGQDFAPAMSNLGAVYEQGLGVDVDLQRAERWYRSAQVLGHERGAVNLACLLLAQGRDAGEVERLLLQYPDNPRALFTLGQLYESSGATEVAQSYYRQAAAFGYEKARIKLSRINLI